MTPATCLQLLASNHTAAELVAIVGQEPAHAWDKGDAFTTGRAGVRKYSAASFESRLVRNAEPEKHVRDILDLVGGAADRLRAFAMQPHAGYIPVRLWTYVADGEPAAIDLSPADLRGIASIGAYLAVTFDPA